MTCWDRLRSNKATGEQSEQGGEWSSVKSEQKLWSKHTGDLALTLNGVGSHQDIFSREVMSSDFHLRSLLLQRSKNRKREPRWKALTIILEDQFKAPPGRKPRGQWGTRSHSGRVLCSLDKHSEVHLLDHRVVLNFIFPAIVYTEAET